MHSICNESSVNGKFSWNSVQQSIWIVQFPIDAERFHVKEEIKLFNDRRVESGEVPIEIEIYELMIPIELDYDVATCSWAKSSMLVELSNLLRKHSKCILMGGEENRSKL